MTDNYSGEVDREKDRNVERQTDRRKSCSCFPSAEHQWRWLSSLPVPPATSQLFPVLSVGYMPPLSLSLSFPLASLSSLPHLPLFSLFFSFSLHQPYSLLPCPLPSPPYPPPHLLTRGVYAESGTFLSVLVKIREKFCSAGWGGGCVMHPQGQSHSPESKLSIYK